MTTYEIYKNKFGFVEALGGTNDKDETVLLSVDEKCASVRTFQSNGWQRINIFYPDGTEEELYER